MVDHYEKPRNVGAFNKNDANVGTGLVGAPACGDVMKLQIRVSLHEFAHRLGQGRWGTCRWGFHEALNMVKCGLRLFCTAGADIFVIVMTVLVLSSSLLALSLLY